MNSSLRRQYGRLTEAGRHRFDLGDLEGACQLLAQAVALGQRLADDELVYRATINLFSVSLETAQPSPPTVARGVLLRSRDPLSRYLAAAALARFYQGRHEHRKALFYARSAIAVAPAERRSTATYTVGVSLLSAGDARGAVDHVLTSLDGWAAERAPVTLPFSVLSYGSALAGKKADARRYIRETEEVQGDTVLSIYDSSVNLNLGYAALELEDIDRAYLYGAGALLSVSQAGMTPSHEHKSALYLLGQSALDLDRRAEAEQSFRLLSRTYYPKDVDVSDLLMTLRTSAFVNWLA